MEEARRETPLLQMRGIEKAYGAVRANAGIDFEVPPGCVVGLLGENGSGKSTLMKILFGMVLADAGSILFKERELSNHTPGIAIAAGIGMVHQHFMLFDTMTVTENVMLGLGRAGGTSSRKKTANAVRSTSERYGLDLDPDAIVGDLPLGRRQRVEIVKTLMRGADLLILDEPTSNLSPPEIGQLLRILRRLRDEGRSVVFISHKLGEVIEICDRIVVLRDGRVVGSRETGDASRSDLARLMVERDVHAPLGRADRPVGEVELALEDIMLPGHSSNGDPSGISFEIHGGEVLALAGVDGNGQLELAETIAGLQRPRRGRVAIGGRDMSRAGVDARTAAGLAYIPSDRALTSLVPALSIAENLMLRDSRRPPLSRRGWLNRTGLAALAKRAIADYNIRAPSGSLGVGRLSGGNQQKIVIAREIGRAPRILVAMQATWGLDPSATRFVLEQVLRLRDQGAAVLYISSELEEVLALGDRIGVMSRGRVVDIVPRAAVDIGRIGLVMGGGAAGADA